MSGGCLKTDLFAAKRWMSGMVPSSLVDDDDTAPQYLYVNGRHQPVRLSFDEPPPGVGVRESECCAEGPDGRK